MAENHPKDWTRSAWKRLRRKADAFSGIRIAAVGAGTGNPGGIHWGTEQAMGLLDAPFYSKDDPDLSEKLKDMDVVLYVHSNARHLLKFRKLAPDARKGWWMNDLRPADNIDLSFIDRAYLCNMEYEDQYRRDYMVDCSYLPQGAPVRDWTEIRLGEPIAWHMVFIGNAGGNKYHAHRRGLLERLGRGWTIEHRNSYKRERRIRIEEQSQYLYKFSPFSLSTSVPAKGYTSNRLYNILSCGGFCLTNDFPGLSDLFEDGTHLKSFRSVEEADMIMKEYYEDHERHFQVKMNGYREFLERHTCADRIFHMLDELCA